MSNWLLRFVFVLFTILAGSAAIARDLPKEEQMIVRIAEIQVDRSQLEEYLKQARTVGAESVSKEPGAYKAHLQTPHFLKYKTSTLSMVKKLDLVDMTPLDEQVMPLIFKKLSAHE